MLVVGAETPITSPTCIFNIMMRLIHHWHMVRCLIHHMARVASFIAERTCPMISIAGWQKIIKAETGRQLTIL